MSDTMLPIAILYSRSEAMVLASRLDAYGILAHIGGYNHACVSVIPMALGGFRFSVPAFQHSEASQIIEESPGFGAPHFSYGLQKAIVKFLILWASFASITIGIQFVMNSDFDATDILFVPASLLSVPVNPQGYGEYFLSGRTTESK